METPAQIWHLIARSLNGEASPAEKEELDQALAANHGLQQQYDILLRVWKERSESVSIPEDPEARGIISRIIQKAEIETSPADVIPVNNSRNRRNWLVAASIIAIGITSWAIFSPAASEGITTSTASIVAQNGSRIRSLLPDGTVVWLNAGSNLTYTDFSGPTREVRLEGEAYFDVVKQPGRPFIVHTSGIDIKVLGTAFNVKSYPEDKNVETTLFKGQVLVLRNNEPDSAAIELKPNEKLVVTKKAAIPSTNLSLPVREKVLKNLTAGLTITKIDSTRKDSERFEIAWLYSRLEFRGENFEQLARKMERWYNVRIEFMDEASKKLNFNGSFEKETVQQAFVALSAAVPFDFNIKGNDISVRSRD